MMINKNIITTVILGASALAAGAVAFYGVKLARQARIGAGYKAKVACSEIFVANRNSSTVLAVEFLNIDPMMDKIRVTVDQDAKMTRAAGPFGLGGVKALYREGYGCTLANGGRIQPLPLREEFPAGAPWPEARPISGQALPWVDYAALDDVANRAFAPDNDANHRGLLVLVDGKIIEERYANGFDRNTRFLSWSAAKSVTAMLTGIADTKGHIDIEARAQVAEWENDPAKSRITWNDLLRMQSGLDFKEHYDDLRSDVNRMLFESADSGGATINKPLSHEPGDFWYYSSGTTNLIVRTLQQSLEKQNIDFYQFAYGALFNPIGASSVLLEPDASGTFIGSSFIYATVRDWARLGQLHLQGGVWNGERILSEGWVDYITTPTKAADGEYGAHYWLNRDGDNGRERYVPGLPEDVYLMAGYEGQYVFMIPSKNMVIVRTGQVRGASSISKVGPLIAEIYHAVGASQ